MSPRTRVRLVVGVAALAAAGIAVGATLIGRGDGGEEAAPEKRGPPVLELSVLTENGAEARGLRSGERAYDEGDSSRARRAFSEVLARWPDSLEAAVGAAVAAWPEGTVARLSALAEEHPDSALVQLHLGLALYASGDDDGAAAAWRAAAQRDPDTPSALRAEDLLHPDIAPGRPFFYPSFGVPPKLGGLSAQKQLEALRQSAASGGLKANLLYGVALQRVGQPLSARAAFARALAEAPDSLAAQVADAVGRFEKDDPSAAFSRLGPLAREHPGSALVRFHLGLLLLWLRDVEDARTQLEQAVSADRDGFYRKEAKKLLSRLEAIRT